MLNALSRIIFPIYRALPPAVRFKLKAIGRVNGHGTSHLDALRGMRDADGKKRLDRAMAKVVDSLAKGGVDSLEGARCLEVGAGFAPSDTLCFHLLGASAAIATDYNRILQVGALRHAIAAADIAALEDGAAGMVPRMLLRERLERLRRAIANGVDGLESVGIGYRAPIDLSVTPPGGPFDLIYSISVFEHIPPEILPAMLGNLAASLSPNGVMLNEIHLEDHLDMVSDPFGFLRRDGGYRFAADIDARGNRLRVGDWERLFGDLPDVRTDIASRQVRSDCRPAAADLLPEFAALSPDDCFTARILTRTAVGLTRPTPP